MGELFKRLIKFFPLQSLAAIFAIVLIAISTSGCGPSWVAEAGGTGAGYDVYRPEPYLLVMDSADQHGPMQTSTAGGMQPISQTFTSKIVYLPDYSTRYRIRSTAGGANIWIKDGWQLSSLSDPNNAAQVLQAIAGGATQAGNAGGDALGVLSLLSGQPASSPGSVYPGNSVTGAGDGTMNQHGLALYKIIYNNDGRVSGLVRVEPSETIASHAQLTDHGPPSVPPFAGSKKR